MASMRLEGRVAIVTGGSQGIGGAIARRLAAEGARIVIADIDEVAGATTCQRIKAEGGESHFVHTDVSDQHAVETLFDQTMESYNRLDILVNNAGIPHSPAVTRHFLEMQEEVWRRVVAIHLDGLFYCSQRAARIMARQGYGTIINMSSAGATRAHRQMVAYDMTKGGIEAATRAMAVDLAPWGIRVNSIVPGAIAVETRAPVGKEGAVQPVDVIPLGRLGRPDEVAAGAAFLASDDASYVTGLTLFIDGGLTVQLRSPMVDAQPLVTDFPLPDKIPDR